MNKENGCDIVIINDKEDDYYRTINLTAMLMDNLSWKAKAIYYYIRTRPEGWKLNTTDLIRKSTDGEASVRAGIKELIEANLLYRFPIRDEKKRITKWKYLSLSKPTKLDKQHIKDLLLENQVYSNNINSNKNILDTSFNKLKGSKVLKDKPISHPKESPAIKETKYHNKVHKLFNQWQDLNIIKHREDSKPYLKALSKLNTYWRNRKEFGYNKIKESFKVYKRLLDEVLDNKYPYKVGLDEFFGFSNAIEKKQLRKGYKNLENIIWFKECLEGYDYVSEKYINSSKVITKDNHPEITRVFKKQCKKFNLENGCDIKKAESTIRTASNLFMDYLKTNKKRFYNESDRDNPIQLVKSAVKCLATMKENNNKVHPGWLSKDFFYTGEFEQHLINQDILKPRRK